jgi:hypothetical protein
MEQMSDTQYTGIMQPMTYTTYDDIMESFNRTVIISMRHFAAFVYETPTDIPNIGLYQEGVII